MSTSRRDLLKIIPGVFAAPSLNNKITTELLANPNPTPSPIIAPPNINNIDTEQIPVEDLFRFLGKINSHYPPVLTGKNEFFSILHCAKCSSKRKIIQELDGSLNYGSFITQNWSVCIEENGSFQINAPSPKNIRQLFDETFMERFLAACVIRDGLLNSRQIETIGRVIVGHDCVRTYCLSQHHLENTLLCRDCLEKDQIKSTKFTPGYQIDFNVQSETGKIYRAPIHDDLEITPPHLLVQNKILLHEAGYELDKKHFTIDRICGLFNPETKKIDPVAYSETISLTSPIPLSKICVVAEITQ